MTEETNNIENTKARSRVTTKTPAHMEIYLSSLSEEHYTSCR